MKRLFPILLVLPLLLVSCTMQSKKPLKQPVVATSFVANADVWFNEMEFKCKIERGDTSEISVTITEPKDLEGISFFCQGEEVIEKLGDLTCTVSPDEIPMASFVMTLSSVFNSMTRVNDLTVAVQNEDYQYKGSCKQGSFTLTQNSDYSYKTLKLNDNLKIDFKDFTTK